MTDKCREALVELVALEDADTNQRDPSWQDAFDAARAALAKPAEPAALTDEQIDELIERCIKAGFDMRKFARAIERAIRSKA